MEMLLGERGRATDMSSNGRGRISRLGLGGGPGCVPGQPDSHQETRTRKASLGETGARDAQDQGPGQG